MRVIVGKPPLWEAIDSTFHVAGKPVIFSWGPVIFNPMGVSISRELMAHEAIHGERQGDDEAGILRWWDRYILDPAFRLAEELPAHQAEYRAYCKRHGSGRDKFLRGVAERLASPLYGNLLTSAAASRSIIEGRMSA